MRRVDLQVARGAVVLAIMWTAVAACGRMAFDSVPSRGDASQELVDADADADVIGIDAFDGPIPSGWTSFVPASPITTDLYATWAFAADDLWIGGVGGAYQFDGTGWVARTGPVNDVYMLWGLAPDDLWEVGRACEAQHWSGTAWTARPIPGCTTTSYFAVGGLATNDVWLAGTSSTLQHWDGAAFTATILTGNTDFWALWPVSASETYFVGTKGTILRRTNTTFTDESIGQNVIVASIWGINGAYWAVGETGLIFHKAVGGTWTAMTSPTSAFLYWVYGRSATDIWAVGSGGTVIHYDGIAWTQLSVPTTSVLRAIAEIPGGDLVMVGYAGTVLRNP